MVKSKIRMFFHSKDLTIVAPPGAANGAATGAATGAGTVEPAVADIVAPAVADIVAPTGAASLVDLQMGSWINKPQKPVYSKQLFDALIKGDSGINSTGVTRDMLNSLISGFDGAGVKEQAKQLLNIIY